MKHMERMFLEMHGTSKCFLTNYCLIPGCVAYQYVNHVIEYPVNVGNAASNVSVVMNEANNRTHAHVQFEPLSLLEAILGVTVESFLESSEYHRRYRLFEVNNLKVCTTMNEDIVNVVRLHINALRDGVGTYYGFVYEVHLLEYLSYL